MDIDLIKIIAFALIAIVNKKAAYLAVLYLFCEAAFSAKHGADYLLSEPQFYLVTSIALSLSSLINFNLKIRLSLWFLAAVSYAMMIDSFLTDEQTYLYLAKPYIINAIDFYILFSLVDNDAIRNLNNIVNHCMFRLRGGVNFITCGRFDSGGSIKAHHKKEESNA